MSNTIISGGLGHIGSKLIRVLLKKNLKVICLDNLSTQRFTSLKGLIGNKNFTFYEVDLAKNYNKTAKILKNTDSTSFIHLAATTNAEASHDNPEILFDNNLSSTKTAIEISSKLNLKLIFPSSTSVYGSAKEDVYEDDDNFINPQSPYAECKVKEENLIIQSGLKDTLILRLGTIFGTSPGMRFHTAVNKFCFQASLGLPVTVWKTAYEQKRPYLGLYDLNSALAHIIEKKLINNETYNLVSYNLKVREIIDIIKLKLQFSIKYVDHEIMNQLSYEVSNRKFINTNFKFTSDINNEIFETLDNIQNLNLKNIISN